MWQDYAMAVTQGILTIGIMPMILHKNKPTLWSSVPTCIGMAVIAFTISTLGLWFSATAAAFASLFWGILVYQRFS